MVQNISATTTRNTGQTSISSELHDFRAEVRRLIDKSNSELSDLISAQYHDMENLNRSSKAKLAAFSQAVSELSNTVQVDFSRKISQLQQEWVAAEKRLHDSIQQGDVSSKISAMEEKLIKLEQSSISNNESASLLVSSLAMEVRSSKASLESMISTTSERLSVASNDAISSLSASLLGNISHFQSTINELSNSSKSALLVLQKAIDDKHQQAENNLTEIYSNFNSQISKLNATYSSIVEETASAIAADSQRITAHLRSVEEKLLSNVTQLMDSLTDAHNQISLRALATEDLLNKSISEQQQKFNNSLNEIRALSMSQNNTLFDALLEHNITHTTRTQNLSLALANFEQKFMDANASILEIISRNDQKFSQLFNNSEINALNIARQLLDLRETATANLTAVKMTLEEQVS